MAAGIKMPEVSLSTFIKNRLPDGRIIAVDNSVWLLRKVPLEPVVDAKSINERLAAAAPLMAAYEELAAMAPVTSTRRTMARSAYRQHQLLMVNLHKTYNPPSDHGIAGYLKQSFPAHVTEKRLLVMAVKLKDTVGGKGGFRAIVDSVAETIIMGSTPLSDYDKDTEQVSTALARCGLSALTSEEMKLASAWWNHGTNPDTVDLPHSSHLHVFSDARSVRMADAAGREDCDSWPEGIPGERALTFASLEGFDFDFINPSAGAALWATGLVADHAVAISIRGNIEPAKVTRDELRRQRKRYLDDIRERAEQNKMERQEQEDMVATLAEIEGVYSAQGGTPTLVDCSVLVAFDGQVEDISTVGAGSSANLRIMEFRQRNAMAEMMLGSMVKANPNLHDVPSQTIAASGIQSLSTVGDKTGALIGFTERDRQPAYSSPTAASSADAAPIFVNLGATGSGKSMVMLWKAIQYAKLGYPQVIIDPKALALDTRIPTPNGWTTMGEIAVGDQVFGRDGKPCTITHKSRIFTPDETRLYEFILDDGQVITADQNHQWVVATPKDRTALQRGETLDGQELDRQAAIAENLSLTTGDSVSLSTNGILQALREAGATRWGIASELRPVLERRGVVSEQGRRLFTWPANVAFKALSAHLREEASLGTNRLRVLTTDELLDHGVKGGAQTFYALPTPAAVEFPQAQLKVDPYLLGAWLGDGTTKSGSIVAGGRDADEMHRLLSAAWPGITKRTIDRGTVARFSFPKDPEQCKRGHQDFVPTVKGSIRCRSCGTGVAEGAITNGSLGGLLSGMSLLGNKHIPERYMRGSVEQRLSLLQGLMDTDGTVHVKRSELRITLTNRRLAEDVLTLVRSLGIKGHWHESPAVLVTRDESGEAVRKTTGTAYAITFQTDREVFRLTRKRSIQPKPKFRSNFLYVKEIRRVESAEAQCIRVDSPDHTYLVGDFVTTHNTDSDHSPTVEGAGGQVASLDNLQKADGIFDPIRFSLRAEVGVELAASMLASIDPWSGRAADYEVDVYNALAYGVSQGATCVGQALKIAYEADKATKELVTPVFRLADSSPMFRACVGVDPQSAGLRVHDGITLIKVGDTHLDLPEPGAIAQASLMQRVSMALVRMMVFGSAMALSGRGGAIHLDEAWVFLGAGKAEVERLGRLARSQQVLPELYTQRASDPLKAGLAGYISRGLILPIEDKDEAKAALELFKLEATPERLNRITAKAEVGSGETTAPNWGSMRALRDPITKKVIRGTVGIYSDLAGRAVPVEIVLPKSFLDLASTNPDDIRRRREALTGVL